MCEYVTIRDINYSYKINLFKKIFVNVPKGTHFVMKNNLCVFNRHVLGSKVLNEHYFDLCEIQSFSKKIIE